VPLLLLHGAADRMVPSDGTRRFAARVRHPDVRFIEYPEAYHALLGDLDSERVIADVTRWMSERI
jgi:alpha-beta hydrolase superfamily lysophospholipase